MKIGHEGGPQRRMTGVPIKRGNLGTKTCIDNVKTQEKHHL